MYTHIQIPYLSSWLWSSLGPSFRNTDENSHAVHSPLVGISSKFKRVLGGIWGCEWIWTATGPILNHPNAHCRGTHSPTLGEGGGCQFNQKSRKRVVPYFCSLLCHYQVIFRFLRFSFKYIRRNPLAEGKSGTAGETREFTIHRGVVLWKLKIKN